MITTNKEVNQRMAERVLRATIIAWLVATALTYWIYTKGGAL